MTQSTIRVSAELFPIKDDSWRTIRNQPLSFYRLDPSPNLLQQVGDLYSAYNYVRRTFANLFPLSAIISSSHGLELVSPSKVEAQELYPEGKLSNDWKIDLVPSREPSSLDLQIPDQYRAFIQLFYQAQQDSMRNQGFSVRGDRIYRPDERIDIDQLTTRNSLLLKIQHSIRLYRGLSVTFRLIERSPFIQIQPKSILDFDADVNSLIRENILSANEVAENFEDVYLPTDRSARLAQIISMKAVDPIGESPFNGRSFLQFAGKYYPRVRFKDSNASLAIVTPRGSPTSWYFSTELLRPSLSFQSLARYDPEFVGNLTSAMKVYSSKRASILDKWQTVLKLNFAGVDVKIGPSICGDGLDTFVDLDDSKNLITAEPFIQFPRPWIRFKNPEGGYSDVSGLPYLAAPGDLLKFPNLRPFDVPTMQIRYKVICTSELEDDAKRLLDRVVNGLPKKHPAFDALFGCSIKESGFSMDEDFENFQIYDDIRPEKYDCVLLIGKRNIVGDPNRTRRLYTHAETSVLRRGVPPQFITDNPSKNPTYDSSLKSKSGDPHVLFGVALNILGKIGAKVMELSPKSRRHFIPDSIVLAYNIARVFGYAKADLSKHSSPRDAITASSAVCAPIVVLTDHGTEIIHQSVHRISDETTLFSSEHALRILSEIPPHYSTIIVHKDGPFHNKELSDLRNLQTRERRIIPVSIVSGNVPRMITSLTSLKLMPRPGLLFKLSSNEFLMSTTLVTYRYNPENRGWPNPIWIKIHDELLEKRLSTVEKLQILYQIWAFARLHLGSENPFRRPVSIHYSNHMNEFMRKVGETEPSYLSGFGGKKNQLGYVPRPFM